MFHPLISRPTRITSNTATLIDNIFTNNIHNCTTSGLLFNDLSDHLPIFVVDVDEFWSDDHSNQSVMYRDKNPTNMTKFSDQLGSVDWSVVENFNDPKIAYTTFHTKFKEIYNCCFPLKKVKSNAEKFINHGYPKAF